MQPARTMVFALALVLAALGLHAPAAEAQGEARAWPQRNVRLILPFGAGSSTDIVARLLGERLQARWGQAVVVENRPGGDGLLSIGTFVSANDDHTFFFGPSSVYLVHPYLHANLPYVFESDMLPIVKLSKTLLVLAAPATLPADDMKQFVALVRASDGKMNYGMTPGFTEFVFQGFLREQALVMSKVPYRDIVQAPIDLGEGRIQILGVSHSVALPQVQAGRVKLLAVADAKRSPLAPDVPSVHESGFPSLESVSILGAYGPRGMALDLRVRVAGDFIALAKEPAIAERLRAAAQDIDPAGPEEFAAAIAQQHTQVAAIARLLGIAKQK